MPSDPPILTVSLLYCGAAGEFTAQANSDVCSCQFLFLLQRIPSPCVPFLACLEAYNPYLDECQAATFHRTLVTFTTTEKF